LEDILYGAGAVMIEWPERIEALLPEDRLWIALSYVSETRRKLRINATGERSAELLEDFKKSAFGV
jgi:tRNA threonylcarbamoyladenosine biosynthesis protein TsaE